MYLFSGGNHPYQFKSLHSGNRITGEVWALDNGCFRGTFNEKRFGEVLRENEDNRAKCLFVVMPDKVGDCDETLRLWGEHAKKFDATTLLAGLAPQ